MIAFTLDVWVYGAIVFGIARYLSRNPSNLVSWFCFICSLIAYPFFKGLSAWCCILSIYWAYQKCTAPKRPQVQKVTIANWWSRNFEYNELVSSYYHDGFCNHPHLIRFEHIFLNEPGFKVSCIPRDGAKFTFIKSDWDRYYVVRIVKTSGADAVILLCPLTFSFYYGYSTYLLKKGFVITSYYAPAKTFTHIQFNAFLPEELKAFSRTEKNMFKIDYHGISPYIAEDLLIFVALTKYKPVESIEGFDTIVTIHSADDSYLQITNENYNQILKGLIYQIDQLTNISTLKRIGILFAAPSSIAFGLGFYLKSHRFGETFHRLHLVEPTDETSSKYLVKKLSDLSAEQIKESN
jgi:hypothetical protein